MSRKDAFAFLRRCSDDEHLRGKIRDKGLESLLQIAKDEGLAFTLDELKEVNNEIRGTTDELSHDLLEMVVGGLSIEDTADWLERNIDKLKSVYDDINGMS